MNQAWLLLILGVGVPAGLYLANRIHFERLMKQTERRLGQAVDTTWKKHKYGKDLWVIKWVGIIYWIVLIIGLYLNNEHILLVALSSMVLPPISIGIPYAGIKGLRSGFSVSEVLTESQLKLWMCNSRKDGFIFPNECENILEGKIKHIEYIPFILETHPLLAEKKTLLAVIKGFKASKWLSEQEESLLLQTKERLWKVENILQERWHGFQVARGFKPLPEVAEQRKAESVKQAVSLLGQDGESSKIIDSPALKELYLLTADKKTPTDILEQANQTIREIEAKVEAEKLELERATTRRSAEAVIQAARNYHGLQVVSEK